MIIVPQRVDGSIQLETTSLEAALQRELDDGAMQAPIRDVEEIGGEDVVVDDQRPAELCCFKILRGNPTKGKSISTFIYLGGSVLKHTDFAVTLHSVQSVGDSESAESADNLVVDMCPRAVSSVTKTRALVVRDFNPGDSLETLKSSVKGWVPNKNSVPKAHFCLPIEGLDAKMVNDTLHTLFDHGAIEGRDGTVSVDVLSQPWKSLLLRECVRIVPRDDPNSAAGSTSAPRRRLS